MKSGKEVSIDYYSHISGLRNINPAIKVLFSFTILVLSLLLDNPFVSIAVILVTSGVTVLKGKIPLIGYFKILLIPIAFILLGTIAIGVEFSKEAAGEYYVNLGFAYMYTTLDKIREMVFLILKVFSAICALQLTTLSTPSTEFISVLVKMKLPKIIAELMYLIYRFIFILNDVYMKMSNSAHSRLGYNNFKTSCYTFGNIAGNMLIVSLKRANTYHDAMESRCYDGDLCFLEEEKKISWKHIAYSLVFIAIIFLIWVFTK